LYPHELDLSRHPRRPTPIGPLSFSIIALFTQTPKSPKNTPLDQAPHARRGGGTNPHAHGKMSAITQASAQVAKTVAVTTGKVSNAKSMMIWRPHGNKYVETKRARERDEMKMKVGEGLAISREGVIIANARCVER